ncbi:MAG: hypothetical protein ACR2QB_03620 [Gammaproteobacteria bacterium]
MTGCSGGGGGGGNIAASEINAANAMPIASAVIQIVGASEDLAALQAITDGLGAPPAAPTRAPDEPPTAEVTVRVDNQDLGLCQAGTVGGTVSVRDPDVVVFEDRLLKGDGANLNLNNCQFEPGEVYSGGLKFSVGRFIGTLTQPVEYIFDFTLRNLRGIVQGEAIEADGDISLFYSEAALPRVDAALSGRRLDITAGTLSATLRNYELAAQLVMALPGLAGGISESFDGYLSSSTFDGEVQFRTLIPFERDFVFPAPIQGRLHIFGANNALLEVLVLGAQVQLNLDADGDGLFEFTTTTTWSALSGEIIP